MATTAEGRTPAHVWIVGILALLWNAYGCFEYVMTQTANQAFLAKYPADALAYFNSLPAWLTAFWAIGVWGGLAGALLLLVRNRYAVLAFALSLIGIVVGIGYQYLATDMPDSMTAGTAGLMPLLVFVVGAFLLWYSRNEDKRGALK